MFPGAYRVRGAVGGELDVSQNRERIGRVWRGTDGALGIRQRLGGIPGSNQQGGVVVQNCGILGIETQRGFEVGAGLAEISVIEFMLAGDEVAGSGRGPVARLFQSRRAHPDRPRPS